MGPGRARLGEWTGGLAGGWVGGWLGGRAGAWGEVGRLGCEGKRGRAGPSVRWRVGGRLPARAGQ